MACVVGVATPHGVDIGGAGSCSPHDQMERIADSLTDLIGVAVVSDHRSERLWRRSRPCLAEDDRPILSQVIADGLEEATVERPSVVTPDALMEELDGPLLRDAREGEVGI